MLTAKDTAQDEAQALDIGADDYLAKPFSYVVLLAGPRCRRGDTEIALTPKERDPGRTRTPGRRRGHQDRAAVPGVGLRLAGP
jgi:hypothetical protein